MLLVNSEKTMVITEDLKFESMANQNSTSQKYDLLFLALQITFPNSENEGTTSQQFGENCTVCENIV